MQSAEGLVVNAAGDDVDDALIAHLWDRRCAVVYKARLSTLYHLKRERFFDMLDKTASSATAIAATAAVGTLLKNHESLDVTVALITAGLSLVPLVFNPAMKARHHGQLAADFKRLLADCERAGEHLTDKQCDDFTSRLMDIAAAEPAPMAALVADCQNQLSLATGEGPVARIGFLGGLLKHWVDFRPPEIPREAA